MLFAYPNFVFKDTTKTTYKYYALVVNLLELITYLANFFYLCEIYNTISTSISYEN